MFKKSLLSFCVALTLGCSFSVAEDYSKPSKIETTEANKKAFEIAANVLANFHYARQDFNLISNDVLKDYIKMLDSTGSYFLKSDIDRFLNSGFDLRTAINNKDLSMPIEIFDVYRQRASALTQWSLWRLKRPFDLKGKGVVYIPNYIERIKTLFKGKNI